MNLAMQLNVMWGLIAALFAISLIQYLTLRKARNDVEISIDIVDIMRAELDDFRDEILDETDRIQDRHQ